ncbi:MAG TPA: transporter substrate-binding domain-containing protein [Opitutaceae bacterium]
MNPKVALFLSLLASFAGAADAADTIRVRADEWMPYNGDPTAAQPGYFIEILREIYTPAAIDYEQMAWVDALKQAEDGAIDCVIGASRAEAARLVLPRESIGRTDTALFVKKESTWSYLAISSLKDAKLGYISGYKYWDAFDRYVQDNPTRVVAFGGETPLDEATRALLEGKIEVFPENRHVFIWKLKESGVSPGAVRTAFTYEGEEVFVAFSAKNPKAAAHAAAFDVGIRQLRRSGRLAEILARYGLRDWME